MLQPNNGRVIKKATDDLFLLYKAKAPAVMVECGFLSNAAETKLLKTDEYQTKLAFVIFISILQYCSDKKIILNEG